MQKDLLYLRSKNKPQHYQKHHSKLKGIKHKTTKNMHSHHSKDGKVV